MHLMRVVDLAASAMRRLTTRSFLEVQLNWVLSTRLA